MRLPALLVLALALALAAGEVLDKVSIPSPLTPNAQATYMTVDEYTRELHIAVYNETGDTPFDPVAVRCSFEGFNCTSYELFNRTMTYPSGNDTLPLRQGISTSLVFAPGSSPAAGAVIALSVCGFQPNPEELPYDVVSGAFCMTRCPTAAFPDCDPTTVVFNTTGVISAPLGMMLGADLLVIGFSGASDNEGPIALARCPQAQAPCSVVRVGPPGTGLTNTRFSASFDEVTNAIYIVVSAASVFALPQLYRVPVAAPAAWRVYDLAAGASWGMLLPSGAYDPLSSTFFMVATSIPTWDAVLTRCAVLPNPAAPLNCSVSVAAKSTAASSMIVDTIARQYTVAYRSNVDGRLWVRRCSIDNTTAPCVLFNVSGPDPQAINSVVISVALSYDQVLLLVTRDYAAPETLALARYGSTCPTNPAISTVALRSGPTIPAGDAVVVTVSTRSFEGSSMKCADVFQAADNTTVFPLTATSRGSLYTLRVAAPQAPGAFVFAVAQNTVLLAGALFNISVRPAAAFGPATIVEGPGLGVLSVDTPYAVTVTARDQFLNVRTDGGDSVRAVLQYSTGALIAVAVTDLGQGRYRASYTMVTAGLYTLSFAINAAVTAPVGLTVLKNCPLGTLRTLTACNPCAADKYAEVPNPAACESCPVGTSTFGFIASVSRLNCTCKPGLYSFEGLGTPCTACPFGATCAGGTALPTANPHFGPLTPSRFYECPNPKACVGGAAVCKASNRGLLCKDCAPGYYAAGTGVCYACATGAGLGSSLVYLLVIVALAAVGAAGLLFTLAKRDLDKSPDIVAAFRLRRLPQSLALGLVAFQTAGVLSSAPDLPSSARTALLTTFQISGLWISALNPAGCVVASYPVQFTIANLGPLAVVAAILGLVVIARRVTPVLVPQWGPAVASVALGDVVEALLFVVAPVVFIPLARASLAYFACTRLPDGRWYLAADLSFRCFAGAWNAWVVVGAAFAILYAFALPLTISYVLIKRRRALFADPSVALRYAQLIKAFRLRFWFMPLLLLLKRLVIVALALFLADTPYLVAALSVLVVLWGVWQYRAKPYFFPELDRLELHLLGSLCAVCVGVLMVQSGGASLFALLVLLAALASLPVVVVVHAVIEGRLIAAQRASPELLRRIPEDRTVAWAEERLRDLHDREGLLLRLGESMAEVSAGRVDENRGDLELADVISSGLFVGGDGLAYQGLGMGVGGLVTPLESASEPTSSSSPPSSSSALAPPVMMLPLNTSTGSDPSSSDS